MARYIDADALYEKLYPLDLVDKRLYTINAKAVSDVIAKTPTADVVPKSEVEEANERIANQQELLNKHKRQIADLQDKLEQAKSEVAREIFEEIEKIGVLIKLCRNEKIIYDVSDKYAKLKEKYMEEKG